MANHTQGPWQISNGEVRSESGKLITVITLAGNGESVPNARLIAAAPELLEALEAIVTADRDGELDFSHIAQANDALAKARGANSPESSGTPPTEVASK